jgi:hypothetical protein
MKRVLTPFTHSYRYVNAFIIFTTAQNDIQAMARCHRIGQTKNVKVYRLLTRKTYEMQMFHMSSLKMGLDQAVLTGFESSSSSGEGAMTKEEVEKLLRVGAYDIFNEDKAGTAEAESNDFKEQDIESILSRRSRKVVHDNTGSGSAAAGGTFSKASFINKTPSKTGDTSNGQSTEDIDINDPDFWTVSYICNIFVMSLSFMSCCFCALLSPDILILTQPVSLLLHRYQNKENGRGGQT